MAKSSKPDNRYKALIESIFFAHWKKGVSEFVFERDEIRSKADELGIALPDNLGDLLYSFRFRTSLPQAIIDTQPKDKVWVIELAGRSRYRFKLFKEARIVPGIRCRPIAAQFMADSIVALFELTMVGDEMRVADERHYRLVPSTDLIRSEITKYSE
jgi:hypothetical protein